MQRVAGNWLLVTCNKLHFDWYGKFSARPRLLNAVEQLYKSAPSFSIAYSGCPWRPEKAEEQRVSIERENENQTKSREEDGKGCAELRWMSGSHIGGSQLYVYVFVYVGSNTTRTSQENSCYRVGRRTR